MTSRIVHGVLLSLLAGTMSASQVTFLTAPHYYLDDSIVFSVTVPEGARPRVGEASDWPVQDIGRDHVGGMDRYWYEVEPRAAGRTHIPSMLVWNRGQTTTIPGTDIDILPEKLTGTLDEHELMKKLRDTHRPPVVGRVTVRPPSAVVGDLVEIVWSAVADGSSTRFRVETSRVTMDHATPFTIQDGARPDDSFGNLAFRTDLVRLIFIPERPGTFATPSVQVVAGFSPPGSGFTEVVERAIASVPIVVTPAPSSLSIGTFSVGDVAIARKDVWPTVRVGVTGSGVLRADQPPLLDGVTIPYVIQLERQTVTVDQTGRPSARRTWTFELHPPVGHEVQLRGVTYPYWDRDLGRETTATHVVDHTPLKNNHAPGKEEEPQPAPLLLLAGVDSLLLLTILYTKWVCSL